MTYLLSVAGSSLETWCEVFSRPILMDCFLVGRTSVCPGFCLMWTDTVPLLSVTRPTLPDLEPVLLRLVEESLAGLVLADLLRVSPPPIWRTVT